MSFLSQEQRNRLGGDNDEDNINKHLFIENIGIGLNEIEDLYKLNLSNNEYLVVGQRHNNNPIDLLDTEYNLIVNNNGIGINATRKELRDTNAGLLVNNNIICKGTIIANRIQFSNLTFDNLNSSNLDEFINAINCNQLFFNGYSNGLINNIYTPSYLTIGNYASTYSNSHLLKISDSPNGLANNIQFSIYNNINNPFEPARLSIGMLGFNENSPSIIYTTTGMPLEFHISKLTTDLNNLYSNGLGLPNYLETHTDYPELAIDTNRCININKDKCDITIFKNNSNINPSLYVNGTSIISNIFTFDYYSNSLLHLDDIYLRKNGLTLKANQIIGGDFINQEFIFNSNLYIGYKGDLHHLQVNGFVDVARKITTEELETCETIVNGIAEFNKSTFFNHNVIFNDDLTINQSINISNDLFIQGYRVFPSNIENVATNNINIDYGCNLSISGRFGTGILNTDNYDNQFSIIKRHQDRFEIYIQDNAGLTGDSSKVYIGHTKLNDLYGNPDNSLIFLTQKNIRWHNFYFYAGKDKDGCYGIKNITPNLAIMENNRIGINTNIPIKTLDVIGDCITNDYFIRINNNSYKLNYIYLFNNSSILDVNNLDINLKRNYTYPNKKVLNISGGINSYDGYYHGNSRIANFIQYPSFNISSIYDNIGIGIHKTDNNYPIPLQIRNITSNINNNTVLRLYRGVKGGGFENNAFYTGIDFCDYDTLLPIHNRNNFKWFIYKNHRFNKDPAGVFQIGYTDNSYNPTHSCINFFYNSTTKKYFIDINNPNVDYNASYGNNAVSIKGNVEIEGNLNLKGANSSYMINGVIVGSFSNPAFLNKSNDINNTTSYTDNNNDLSFIANKIGIFPSKSSIISFKDDWIFSKINDIQLSPIQNNPLFIYNNRDYFDDSIPPVVTKFYNKSFKNYHSRPDIAIIELGILSDINNSGDINNKVEFKLKGYSNDKLITIFEITPNNQNIYPFLSCINYNNRNQINIGSAAFYTSNSIIYPDTAFHIHDDYNCLLRLTNNNQPVQISLNHDYNKWDINANNNLVISYSNLSQLDKNDNSILFNMSNDGSIIFNQYNYSSNHNSSFNINSLINESSLECTNYYASRYINDDIYQDKITDGYINIPYSNLFIKPDVNHFDTYDDNFDNNISHYTYLINDSNLPQYDIHNNPIFNYSINTCNYSFDSNIIIDFNTNLYDVPIDYRHLNNIPFYIDSNTIELIPTISSYNPNIDIWFNEYSNIPVSYKITNDINLQLNYKTPKTTNSGDLFITSMITYSNISSNYLNNVYSNLNITTFLNVKDNESTNYKIKTIQNLFTIPHNNSNYYYNTINSIYYYPSPNINIYNIGLHIRYNYNYRNLINVPINFFDNYLNNIHIISNIDTSVILNNSNLFLSNAIYADNELTYLDTYNFISTPLISSNIVNKLYDIEINNNIVKTLNLSFLKYDYFNIYDFGLNNPDFFIPIINNDFKPHLTMKNFINDKYTDAHKFYSYKNDYQIHLNDKKLISIDSNGSIYSSGSIEIDNLYFKGDLFIKNGNNIQSITSNLTHLVGSNFYIHKNNISLNSSNIFLNPVINENFKGGIIINGSDINDNNNLFQINNYVNNDDFISLNSVSNSGFIHFTGTNHSYKFGMNNGNFGLWKNISSTYTNLLHLQYIPNTSNLNIDINGHIKTSNDFAINDVTTYVGNSSLNYKMRVFGNLKVDGTVISSSDRRIKTDIVKIDNALDKIEKLCGVTFGKINDNSGIRHTGLIAQEVKEVIPEAVFEDNNGLLNIAYGNLMGLIVEAIKELRKEIKNQ